MNINRTSTAAANVARATGMFMRQAKKYRPLQRTIEKDQNIRTMDDVYDCICNYISNVALPRSSDTNFLQPRTSNDSELSAVLPLSYDEKLRLRMSDKDGNIRIGRLLEHIDVLSPCCGYMLSRDDLSDEWFAVGTLPRVLVTWKIHPVNFTNATRLSASDDVYIHGKVTWTDKFSSETTVTVSQNGMSVLETKFVFISLDGKALGKKCAVNQLVPSTSYEADLLASRRVANSGKRVLQEESAVEKPVLMERDMEMSRTRIEHTRIVHPENQNPYGTTFGGFLLRQGLESAEACARLFTKGTVRALSMDSAEFTRVVEIGSIVKYSAFVCNVNENIVQVCSLAEVFEQKDQTFKVCDRFHFSFEASTADLPRVVPFNMRELLAQKKAREVR